MDKQDKPLSEWTLGEVQALCEKRNGDGCCDDCPFANVIGNCTLRVLPEEWDLKEAPRLTDPEIAIMRAVGARWVSRESRECDFVMLSKGKPLWDEKYQDWLLDGRELDDPLARIRGTLFPSVKPGDCIGLEDE